MVLKLYRNKSEDNKLDKELEDITQLNGVLRENCSILNPVIKVSGFNNAMAAICNYAFIPEFARKYFVTDIISLGNSYWEIHMRVDVLSSFSEQIKKQTAIIVRQERKYNMLLNDAAFKQQQNRLIQEKNFSCNFNDIHYVFIIAGGS